MNWMLLKTWLNLNQITKMNACWICSNENSCCRRWMSVTCVPLNYLHILGNCHGHACHSLSHYPMKKNVFISWVDMSFVSCFNVLFWWLMAKLSVILHSIYKCFCSNWQEQEFWFDLLCLGQVLHKVCRS